MTHLWPPRALGLQTPAQEGLERETGRVKGVGAGSQTEAGSRAKTGSPAFLPLRSSLWLLGAACSAARPLHAQRGEAPVSVSTEDPGLHRGLFYTLCGVLPAPHWVLPAPRWVPGPARWLLALTRHEHGCHPLEPGTEGTCTSKHSRPTQGQKWRRPLGKPGTHKRQHSTAPSSSCRHRRKALE